MKTSSPGTQLISRLEGGMKLKVYKDSAGYDTVGVGHLVMDYEDFSGGITHEQGLALLADDLFEAEDAVSTWCLVPLTQSQFDALVCFTFNVGVGAFRRSTLLRVLNVKKYGEVGPQMERWNRAAGKVSKGLVRRRKVERALFDAPDPWQAAIDAGKREGLF